MRDSLPEQVARQLQTEILEQGWPVGAHLGSETELVQRFKVSRWVIREAQRILESRRLARPRPGPGGGLFVTAPEPDAVIDVAELLIAYRGFAAPHLFDLWVDVEAPIAEALAERIDEPELVGLRAVMEDVAHSSDFRVCTRTIHTEIARLSANPIAELVTQMCNRLFHAYAPQASDEQLAEGYLLHVELFDAISSRDGSAAAQSVRRTLQQTRDALFAGSAGNAVPS